MKKFYFWTGLFLVIFLVGCNQTMDEEFTSFTEEKVETIPVSQPDPEEKSIEPIDVLEEEKEALDLDSFNRNPTQWGEFVEGVKTRIQTNEKIIALTFDACGGAYGSGYDETLIAFLREENVPATLFVNERWIHENEDLFMSLAQDPLFQIENHGTHHSPLSVVGGEAWGIPATSSPQEVYDEIMNNHETVKELTGREMTLFRSGTAFYDEVAVELANALGYEAVNFDVLGDAGATFSSEQVKNALLNSKEGSIPLLHMNQPKSGTAEGVMKAVPLLKEQGFQFVLLEDKQLE